MRSGLRASVVAGVLTFVAWVMVALLLGASLLTSLVTSELAALAAFGSVLAFNRLLSGRRRSSRRHPAPDRQPVARDADGQAVGEQVRRARRPRSDTSDQASARPGAPG